LPPTVISVSAAPQGAPNSFAYRAASALRSSGMPAMAVYLVNPDWSACTAAATAQGGESKSGSPAPKSTTSTPWALSSSARRATLSVADSVIRSTRAESRIVSNGIIRTFVGASAPALSRDR
jgi:hypothetical protein